MGHVADGAAVRILARTLVVDDLSKTVGLYERNFGWEPVGPPSRGADGVLRARFQPTYPRGAALELLEPEPSVASYEADFARAYGHGACSIRFAVHNLATARERLSSLGVTRVEAHALDGGGSRLIRPAEYALGTAFELVEWDGS